MKNKIIILKDIHGDGKERYIEPILQFADVLYDEFHADSSSEGVRLRARHQYDCLQILLAAYGIEINPL